MNQGGYTLVEMMIALVVISLTAMVSAGGLDLIRHSIGASSDALAQFRTRQALFREWSAQLSELGPVGGETGSGFEGRPRAFRYDCGVQLACGLDVTPAPQGASVRFTKGVERNREFTLKGVPDAHLVYGDDFGVSTQWSGRTSKAPLRWLALVGQVHGEDEPLASVRLRVDVSPTCQFDAISRQCRSGAP